MGGSAAPACPAPLPASPPPRRGPAGLPPPPLSAQCWAALCPSPASAGRAASSPGGSPPHRPRQERGCFHIRRRRRRQWRRAKGRPPTLGGRYRPRCRGRRARPGSSGRRSRGPVVGAGPPARLPAAACGPRPPSPCGSLSLSLALGVTWGRPGSSGGARLLARRGGGARCCTLRAGEVPLRGSNSCRGKLTSFLGLFTLVMYTDVYLMTCIDACCKKKKKKVFLGIIQFFSLLQVSLGVVATPVQTGCS